MYWNRVYEIFMMDELFIQWIKSSFKHVFNTSLNNYNYLNSNRFSKCFNLINDELENNLHLINWNWFYSQQQTKKNAKVFKEYKINKLQIIKLFWILIYY
jgi:hypothetical protein